jgi:hypothetical protein
MTPPRQPDLSIVIVTWNVRDLLAACLRSIAPRIASPDTPEPAQDKPTAEVIVVDNASTDGTAEMLTGEFPWVKLIQPQRNTGFSAGNNLGLAAAQGRYVLVLNPDTLVLDSALASMTGHMDRHPDTGVLAPRLLNPDGTVQSSRRRFPTLWTAFFESTWLQPIAPRRVLERYYMLDLADDATTPVDWAQGTALLVRHEVIAQVGGFDEGFFMYSEELDWQRRIRAAGWPIVYFPEARIVHYGGKSSEQVIALRHIAFQTSKVRYFRKHHGRAAGCLVRGFLLMSYIMQLGLEGAKWLVGHKRDLRAGRMDAYWQVLRSGLKG